MKTLNAAIVTTVLALGLAGTSMAAPGHSDNIKLKQAQAKHQVAQKQTKKVVVKKVVKKAPVKIVKKKVAVKTYRVRSGDTLSKIAARYNVSLNKLIQVNKLWGNKANNLNVGMTIRLG